MKTTVDYTPRVLPVLPMKNTVLFPGLFLPLTVGRPGSVAAIEAVLATEEKEFLAVTQKDASNEQPGFDELAKIGVRAVIKKAARGDEILEVLVQGLERVELLDVVQTEPYLTMRVQALPALEDGATDTEMEALKGAIIETAGKILEAAQVQSPIPLSQLAEAEPTRLVYLLGSLLGLDVTKEQALLEVTTKVEALRLMHGYLVHELQVAELRQTISRKAESEMTQAQREFLLRKQMQAIQDELGEQNPEKAELDELRQRLLEADLPPDVRLEAEKALARLERMPPAAPDYQIGRSHLELILELPWNRVEEQEIDLAHARQVLDEDHFGLTEIKERILEHLAVLKLNPKAKAPILLLVGPPGVGKTSLGQSIARALGRKFERFSLGGLHDEAELRGHRRTYIGAMPGRFIQALKRAGVKNPVLLLDEVDKLGRDFRGDPSSALLEVLDPAQNHTFRDNYLDLPFDLSRVLFLMTANSLEGIPRPLLDRMEMLTLSGYSEEEKVQIARRYLLPRQMAEAGLNAEQMVLSDEVLLAVVRRYTREAGVRDLERQLGRIARKLARQVAEGTAVTEVTVDKLTGLLGPERIRPERFRKELTAGVSTGLAWTETGGDVLYIEATLLPQAHGLRLTGQLGEVMKESAKAARSFVWSHALRLGITPQKMRHNGVHIHVPAGAVPKDGPSAGVAMTMALVSAFTGVPVRKDVAMTGEITLTGLVLPVGGIKEKVLAARRAGMKTVILPRDNEIDLRELPEEVRTSLEFKLVETAEEALAVALPDFAARLEEHAVLS
jgi:ATP-dependent Lon protease